MSSSEVLSLAVGVVGTAVGLVGVLVSLALYRRAKDDAARAEAAINETLRVAAESREYIALTKDVVDDSRTALEGGTRLAAETLERLLALVLELDTVTSLLRDEKLSKSVDMFLRRVIEHAAGSKGSTTVGELRSAVAQTAWSHADTSYAIERLQKNKVILLDGPRDQNETTVRLA